MVFEKVMVPQATVLPVFAGDFKRYSNDLTVALTAQITTLWARAETLDLNSNIQDKVIKTAYIDDLAVTNAQIANCAVSKLTAGSITSQIITLALTGGTGDVCIKGGKTDFGDNTAGMIFGMDDSDSDRMKFEVGDASTYVKWDGLTLSVKGSITVTAGSVPNANVTGLGTLALLNTVTYGGATVTGFGALAALGSVAASNCDTTIISGGKIITGLLTADNIQAGTLNCSLLTVTNINAASITVGTIAAGLIEASTVYIKTANIDNLNVTTGKIANNAAATPIFAFTAAQIDCYSTAPPAYGAVFQTAAITSVGSPIKIVVAWAESTSAIGDPGGGSGGE